MQTSFLQSKQWEDFQRAFGRQVFRQDGILIIKHNLPLGKYYFYCPRPVQVPRIKNRAKAIFFRAEPSIGYRIESLRGFRKAKREIQPSKTLILDLDKSEEDLLSQMKKKTRYSIKLAQRKGVKVHKSRDFEAFWRLLQETAKRQKITTHAKEYYQKMLEMPMAELFLAKYQNIPLAAGITIFYQNRATSLHGASSDKIRYLRAPYLLQWERIREAKKRGMRQYDFWGISEKWPGVSQFKRGFGGRIVTYIGTWDLVFQPFWYKLYNLFTAWRA